VCRLEQEQREEEARRADEAVKYKDQLENFIDMICHEIRNPYVLHGVHEFVWFGGVIFYLQFFNSSFSLLD
jgi:hypothetical protein